jgi:hypothetical protein
MRSSAYISDVLADFATLKAKLDAVESIVAKLLAVAEEGEVGSYTLKQFRKRHGLSESQYHKLKNEGRGPRLMSTGDVSVRISVAADHDWICAREKEAAANEITEKQEIIQPRPDP